MFARLYIILTKSQHFELSKLGKVTYNLEGFAVTDVYLRCGMSVYIKYKVHMHVRTLGLHADTCQ